VAVGFLLVLFCLPVSVMSMSNYLGPQWKHLLGAAECVVTSCVFVRYAINACVAEVLQ
jgi:hypothetical protein